MRAPAEGAEASDKGLPGDYVTEVDLASERAIRRMLEQATPSVPVLGEESGGEAGDRYWLVDPLDGTVELLHGFWAVGVSVALVEEGRPVAGAVHAPFLGTTWTASRRRRRVEAGRRRTRRSRSGSATGTVARAVVGTGFPFRHKELVPRYLEAFRAAFERFEDLRRPGAAALDLAWVADGTFDGFFELSLGSWDVAAGAAADPGGGRRRHGLERRAGLPARRHPGGVAGRARRAARGRRGVAPYGRERARTRYGRSRHSGSALERWCHTGCAAAAALPTRPSLPA